ncbi:MAG: biliverdin-producing heme oxygenase [Nibricoccus sp.]
MRLLQALKTHTAVCHQDLENSLSVFSRIRTRDDYGRLLEKFLTLYEPLEAQLGTSADWRALDFDFDAHRKTAWLRGDLAALGVNEAEINSWERCRTLPSTEGVGAAIGCLYVLEGSTLGGQMISKQFRETLGVTPETGGRFFNGYGAETGQRWRAFGMWAQTADDRAGGLEQPAAEAAKHTFACFGQWLKF